MDWEKSAISTDEENGMNTIVHAINMHIRSGHL